MPSQPLTLAKDILIYPNEEDLTYANFSEVTRANLLDLFAENLVPTEDPSTSSARLTLEEFERNTDHGMEHEYNVYKRSLEIALEIESETGEVADRKLLYIMALAHDSARSIVYPDATLGKLVRQKRNDKNHEQLGWRIVKRRIQLLKSKGYEVSPEDEAKLQDYLPNHDFFSKQLNGARFQEPSSLEWQIVRLADRISVPLKDEINRYRDTGKRLGTPFFLPEVPLEVRMSFSFDNMHKKENDQRLYIADYLVDEVMFFIGMLMIQWSDFSHPTLARLYEERAVQKVDAAKYILEISDIEDPDHTNKEKLRLLLESLWRRYGFSV